MHLDGLSLLALIGFLTAMAQWVALRLRLPAILFLLLFGMAIGSGFGLLKPDELFGDLLFPVISLSVAIILFEGSLTLKRSELAEIGSTVRNLVTIGVAVTWLVTTTIAYFVGIELPIAILFGALVVVTGPTVIVPMLRTVRPTRPVANILRWEGIVIDPIGALAAVLAFNLIVSATLSDATQSIATIFAIIVVVGTGLGVAAGFALGFILRKDYLPEYLRSPFTLLMVCAVFAISEAIEHESGLLAVTVFGIVLANYRGIDVHDILNFKESIVILLIGGLFILLAARIDGDALIALGPAAFVILAGIIFVARPLAVFASSIGSDLTFNEKLLISWIGPRGIVCAAVAAIFALRLENLGVSGADQLVPLAFIVIIGTVVLQSLTSKPIANMLGVRDPAPTGFLVVGGGRIGRMLARQIADLDLRVVVADSDWDNISQARMDGLETYFGNPVSEHADRYLDLSGIGNLIALSGRVNVNVVNSLHFKPLFGEKNLYELPSSAEGMQDEKHRISGLLRGHRLFGEDETHNQVLGLMNQGWLPRTTPITEEFTFGDYLSTYENRTLPLFAQDASGRLRVVTDGSTWQPEAGWKVIALVAAEDSTP